MKPYLERDYDWNQTGLVSQYDELPLWSSPFGRLLLDHIPLDGVSSFIDVGCGTGFPLIEIAQRIGASCTAIGIDPWERALERCSQKIATLGLENIRLIATPLSNAAIETGSADLITCNLGINNFEDVGAFFAKCREWLRPEGTLAITTNCIGTFGEFYALFEEVLASEVGGSSDLGLQEHIAHRGTLESISRAARRHGFALHQHVADRFKMRFRSGSAFFNHSVINSGFFPSWKRLIPLGDQERVFAAIEKKIDTVAAIHGEFCVTIPADYLEFLPSQPEAR